MARSRTKGGQTSANPSAIDERVLRTRNKIADAIIAMGKRQPIDSISVGALCVTAGISRSTFYAHFGSLRNYLITSYAGMLERGAKRGARVLGGDEVPLAIAPILDHIGHSGAYGRAILESTHHASMSAAGEDRLARIAAENLKRLAPGLPEADRIALATFIAGGFMGVLRRWKSNDMRESAEMIRTRFDMSCQALLAAHLDGKDVPKIGWAATR